MHEWPMVEEAVKEIINQAQDNRMKNVASVTLAIGREDHITPESLEVCFRSLAGDTILEKTRLETTDTDGRGIVIVSIEGD